MMSKLSILVLLAILGLCAAAPLESQNRTEIDPELTGGYFEGDMILPEEDNEERNGLRDERYRWPNRIVYYQFSGEVDQSHRNHVLHGMRQIEAISCIRFQQRTNQAGYVLITGKSGGCYSTVGYTGKAQTYNLQLDRLDSGCYRIGTIVHEFLHTLGFYHMQSSANRDAWVRIAYENVQAGTEHNFNKYGDNVVTDFGQGYDYNSVMHYGPYAFSKNGQMTIQPLKNGASQMGQRNGMTQSDITRLNGMYRC